VNQIPSNYVHLHKLSTVVVIDQLFGLNFSYLSFYTHILYMTAIYADTRSG